MKLIRNDKYFVMDIINMVFGCFLIIMGIIAFTDVYSEFAVLPYILLLGGIINMLNGSKQSIHAKLISYFYFGFGYLCLLVACIIWMGFGG